jgi:hypothetical protein
MEFRTKKAKKKAKIMLFTGYFLVGIAVALSTVVLVYQAKGYDYDRKRDEIIVKGLLYVDTDPTGADIFINGKQQSNQSNTKISLEEGDYDLKIAKKGFYDWTKKIRVDGAQIEYILYPKLISSDLIGASKTRLNLGTNYDITKVFESPDLKTIYILQADDKKQYNYINIDSTNPTILPLDIPELTKSTTNASQLSVLDWSPDSKALLLSVVEPGLTKKILYINFSNPSASKIISQDDTGYSAAFFNSSADAVVTDSKGVTGLLNLKNLSYDARFSASSISEKSIGEGGVVGLVKNPITQESKLVAQIGGAQIGLDAPTFDYNSTILQDKIKYNGKLLNAIYSSSAEEVVVYEDLLGTLQHRKRQGRRSNQAKDFC